MADQRVTGAKNTALFSHKNRKRVMMVKITTVYQHDDLLNEEKNVRLVKSIGCL